MPSLPLPPYSPLRLRHCLLIRITGGECVTGSNAHQLLMSIVIVALSHTSANLRPSPGVTMGTRPDLKPSSPTSNPTVVPPTPGTVGQKAKVTFPDSRIVLRERQVLEFSRHRHPLPSIAAPCIITSEARHPLPSQLSTAVWYPKSHPKGLLPPSTV